MLGNLFFNEENLLMDLFVFHFLNYWLCHVGVLLQIANDSIENILIEVAIRSQVMEKSYFTPITTVLIITSPTINKMN